MRVAVLPTGRTEWAGLASSLARLFPGPDALTRAGVPDPTAVDLASTTDPEDFVTADGAYRAATATPCPTLAKSTGTRFKKLRPKWLGSLPRERHPKGYLQWLCIAPAEKNCTSYSESDGGAKALENIHWGRLLGRGPTQFGLLRAMLEDIAYCLGTPATPALPGGPATTPTALAAAPQDKVLRNI